MIIMGTLENTVNDGDAANHTQPTGKAIRLRRTCGVADFVCRDVVPVGGTMAEQVQVQVETTRKVIVSGKWIFFEHVKIKQPVTPAKEQQ